MGHIHIHIHIHIPASGGEHEEGVKEARAEEEKHEREAVEHTCPEVVGRQWGAGGLRDEHAAGQYRTMEGRELVMIK